MTHPLRLVPLTLLALLASAASLFSAETPIPPSPSQWVTDEAGFLSTDTARSLNGALERYAASTGRQLLVYIGKTTGDTPIEDWAVRAFEKWKVGRKGMDDGVALFIFAEDKRLRIEVGYGLEAKLTDAYASRIINEVMVPRIRAGDNGGAVVAGVNAIAGITAGEELPAADRGNRRGESGKREMTLGQLIFFGVLFIAFLALLKTHPALAMMLLMSFLSGGRGGGRGGMGGFGGGGGFSGGGGRSGGGGASGSW